MTNNYQKGSLAELKEIKKYIRENSIKGKKANELLKKHEQDRKEYLEKRYKNNPSADYYPAGGLPHDSVLVVRTTALRDLEELIATENSDSEKPPSKRQQKSDLHIIGALRKIIMDNKIFPTEEELRMHIADEYDGFQG